MNLTITKIVLRKEGFVDLYAQGHKYADAQLFDPGLLEKVDIDINRLQPGQERHCLFIAVCRKSSKTKSNGNPYLDVLDIHRHDEQVDGMAWEDLVLDELRAIRTLLQQMVTSNPQAHADPPLDRDPPVTTAPPVETAAPAAAAPPVTTMTAHEAIRDLWDDVDLDLDHDPDPDGDHTPSGETSPAATPVTIPESTREARLHFYSLGAEAVTNHTITVKDFNELGALANTSGFSRCLELLQQKISN